MSATQRLLDRRKRLLGADAPLFYEQALHIVRGEGVWLYAEDGRRYLDCYNNVPHVGHCNADVVAAISQQAATLNVHTRYLHEQVLDYAERLTDTLDDTLSMAMFTCTGSEANDQALRIARLSTGGEGIICTALAYHGNTTAVDQVSPLFYPHAASHSNVNTIAFPDSYRPAEGLTGAALSQAYLEQIRLAIEDFEQRGVGFAGLIVCPIFANEGLPQQPPDYLRLAADLVHQAGGLFIADEVQAGLGRSGAMWGHQLFDVVPDIVTMGKPMGNGFPLAAVVSRADLIERFRAEVMYFNTFGGNPVACAAGNAVLDVMQRDNLINHARDVGDYIRAGFGKLADRHQLIGDIRGHGLWVGVELVEDRHTKVPATALTKRLVNEVKERGVLLNRIGQFDNVLKMRPPLPFTYEHADLLLSTVDEAMSNL